MATIIDNRDGTFTIKRPGQPDEIRTPGGGDETPAPQQPAPTPPSDGDGGGRTVEEILADLQAAVVAGTDTNSFNNAILQELQDAGLSRREALDSINSTADRAEAIIAAGSAGPDAGTGAGGFDDAAGGDPTGATGIETGLGGEILEDTAANRFSELSRTFTGRGNTFADFVASNLGEGVSNFARRAAGRQFSPLNAAFLLNQANEPSGFGQAGIQSFQDFIGSVGNVPTGNQIRDLLSSTLGAAGQGSILGLENRNLADFRANLEDIDEGRSQALRLAQASSGVNRFSPFGDAFGNVLGNRFNRFIGSGEGNPFQFLEQFVGGGF